MREWREEVRLGTMREWDPAPWLLVGRSLCSRSRVRGRVRKEPVSPSLNDGAMTQNVDGPTQRGREGERPVVVATFAEGT